MAMRRRTIVDTLVLVLLIALIGGVWLQRQALMDWWRLRGYQPPANVATMTNDDTFTPLARHILYVNHPLIDANRASFNHECPSGSEKTIVLGCYHGNQNGVYLFSVTDPQLNGVEQVTLAHEMLHAAYDRLSAGDKQTVDAMLVDYYQHGLHDQRVIAVMDAYKQSEPKDVVNEMHSVFGTEIATLPQPLESYYLRYFSNRAAVTGFAAQYEQTFTTRDNQVAQDDAQLAQLNTQITADQSSLQAQASELAAQQAHLDGLRAAGNFAGYNAGVASYNQKVSAYNSLVVTIKGLINQYNVLVTSRNAIALQTQELRQELSSQAVTQSPR